MSIEHKDITGANMHPPTNWSFANTAARTAAGSYVSGDVGKWAEQTDNGTIWRLVSFDGGGVPTWTQLGGSASGGASSINLSGTYASLPAASTAGRLYKCTDSPLTLRDNGSSWDAWHNDFAVTLPPSLTALLGTGVTATVDRTKGFSMIDIDSGQSLAMALYKKALANTTNYTATICCDAVALAGNTNVLFGIAVRNSSNGNVVGWGPFISGGNISWNVGLWTSVSAYSANISQANYSFPTRYTWFRIKDDGTTRFYQWSIDGQNWATYYSQGRTVSVTPDEVGIFCTSGNVASGANNHSYASFFSFKEA